MTTPQRTLLHEISVAIQAMATAVYARTGTAAVTRVSLSSAIGPSCGIPPGTSAIVAVPGGTVEVYCETAPRHEGTFTAAAGLSAAEEERRETERVLAKPIEEFTRRNAAKNEAGFLVVEPKGDR